MSAARLEDRRRAELRSKLSSIGEEFEQWRAASVRGALLSKHSSQIERTTEALAGLVDRIEQDLGDAEGEAVLGRSQRIERSVLDLHRLWDYFRSKLALRYVPWFQQPLYAVDELAWACYEPVQQAVAPELRAGLKNRRSRSSMAPGARTPPAAGARMRPRPSRAGCSGSSPRTTRSASCRSRSSACRGTSRSTFPTRRSSVTR
jgi:hypothetical protein